MSRGRRAGSLRRIGLAIGLVGAWLLVVLVGLVALWKYAATPGLAASPPRDFPVGASFHLEEGRATILMLAHPRCPCTRASIAELAVLMSQAGDRARARVFFLRPEGEEEGWEQTDLWRSAAAIPNVTVSADRGGVEAARFGALTSGQVVVYDAGGVLRYRGGITDSRGHQGDNVGLRTILEIVRGGRSEVAQAPVFGCSLVEGQ